MRHVILTCKNHPNLRWSTKEIAVNANGSYNGCRNIFFGGETPGEMHSDGSGFRWTWSNIGECVCPASNLIVAPEDALIKAAAAKVEVVCE